MEQAIFFTPVFKHCVWGGTRIASDFSYDVTGSDVGECWGIAAHTNGDVTVREGAFSGMRLSEVYKEHRELFFPEDMISGSPDTFPLLVKIIDASDDLSIQVHPDDAYANAHENGSLGKTECWYVIDAAPGAKLVAGHRARDRQEFETMAGEGRWSELLRYITVKPGDFLFIPPGTVHTIGKGILLLETQQNSDVTYRLYDYDRLWNGRTRELHTQKSLDVISFPDSGSFLLHDKENDPAGSGINKLAGCEYFNIWRVNLKKGSPVCIDTKAGFALISILSGKGSLSTGQEVAKGDHLLIPISDKAVTLEGELKMIMSSPSGAVPGLPV